MLNPSSILPGYLWYPFIAPSGPHGQWLTKIQNAPLSFMNIPLLSTELPSPTVLSWSKYFLFPTTLLPQTWRALDVFLSPSCLLPAFLLSINPAWKFVTSNYTVHCAILEVFQALRTFPSSRKFSSKHTINLFEKLSFVAHHTFYLM